MLGLIFFWMFPNINLGSKSGLKHLEESKVYIDELAIVDYSKKDMASEKIYLPGKANDYEIKLEEKYKRLK